MFAALLGVASFHRACLLAQDFTHEPACQTGERAPQGRFRHQPEQMVHPPFAWQLASFPSLPVCGEEAPYCPLRDFVTLRTTPQKSRHGKPFLPSSQCTRNWSRSSEELCQTIGDIFSGGLVEAAPLLASSNRTQCSVSRGESGQHPKKQMRLEIIHGVLITFQQPVGDVMYTGQEIMHGLTKTPYLTLPESSGRRKRHVPSTVLCGILSERDDMLFLCPIQSTRNWPRSSGGTSRIIRECFFGDT